MGKHSHCVTRSRTLAYTQSQVMSLVTIDDAQNMMQMANNVWRDLAARDAQEASTEKIRVVLEKVTKVVHLIDATVRERISPAEKTMNHSVDLMRADLEQVWDDDDW